MSMLAETANVDYHLSFANQEKQTFRFPLVLFSIYIYIETSAYTVSIYISLDISNSINIYWYMYMLTFQTENGAEAIFLNPLPFAHRTNVSLSFVCLFTKKQKEVIRLPSLNGLNGLAHLCKLGWQVMTSSLLFTLLHYMLLQYTLPKTRVVQSNKK
jgi:hypothetical protein